MPDTAPDSSYKAFHATVAQDDTNTTVTIFTMEPYVGLTAVAVGRARRRKGDTRNSQLGMALATGRAFRSLAEREERFADEILDPTPPEPDPESEPTFEQGFVNEVINMLKGDL